MKAHSQQTAQDAPQSLGSMAGVRTYAKARPPNRSDIERTASDGRDGMKTGTVQTSRPDTY
jgi:hypothetical protein